jgi:hypothetical protein
MVEIQEQTRYSHRRVALRLAERAAELTARDSVSTVDIELLQIELDELWGWVRPDGEDEPR